MSKKIVCLALAVVFTLSMAGLGFAAKLKCTVDSVEGETVTMKCEKADKMKAGDKIKVTPAKKKGAIEGC